LAVEHANRPQEIDQSVDRFNGLIVALNDRAGKFIEWCFGVGRDGLVKFFVASPRSGAQGVSLYIILMIIPFGGLFCCYW
jgi:hypothetical protein